MGAQSRAKRDRRERRAAILRQVEQRGAEVEALFDDFEALLARLGLEVRRGSKLEEALLFVRHLKYIRDEKAALPDLSPEDEDAMFARACWLWGMAPKLIAASRHPDFRQLVPHIKYVVTSEFAQNVPGQRDQEADKLFELVVALAILPRAKNLRVDTGKDADRNPDLMFDFNGVRWAIACKGLYALKAERYRDSVIKGAQQIERSNAKRGVVCVSLRNFISQKLFLPREGETFTVLAPDHAKALLAQEEERFRREIIAPVARDIARDFATRTKVERAVLHVSAVCARTGYWPDDIRLTYMARIADEGNPNDELVDALNAGLQPATPPLPRV